MNVRSIMRSSTVAMAATLGFLVCSAEVSAQTVGGYGARNPWQTTLSNPTVSPYLSLLQRQSEGLPLYYTQVRPQIEQMDFNRNQQTAVNRVQSQLNNVQQQQQQGVGQFGQIGIRPTGRRGVSDYRLMFGNHSHYYAMPR